MKRTILILFTVLFFLMGCSEPMFFPVEKAKTDGTTITYEKWLNFSDKKQTVYVKEYVTHVGLNLEKEFTNHEIVAALNSFAADCDVECAASPMTKILSNLTVAYELKATAP